MTVFVLIREDQNQHGYIDTSIAGVFLDRRTAAETKNLEERKAREEGLVVEDERSDGEWDACWSIQEHAAR